MSDEPKSNNPPAVIMELSPYNAEFIHRQLTVRYFDTRGELWQVSQMSSDDPRAINRASAVMTLSGHLDLLEAHLRNMQEQMPELKEVYDSIERIARKTNPVLFGEEPHEHAE